MKDGKRQVAQTKKLMTESCSGAASGISWHSRGNGCKIDSLPGLPKSLCRTGNHFLAGSAAAAIRFLARAIMTGAEVSEKFFRNPLERDQARGNLASDRGIGRDVVVRFLDGVPGINDGTVRQQLSNLKSSGDYARIIGEIQQEIEEENKEALKA